MNGFYTINRNLNPSNCIHQTARSVAALWDREAMPIHTVRADKKKLLTRAPVRQLIRYSEYGVGPQQLIDMEGIIANSAL
jgi:hypothetical protein